MLSPRARLRRSTEIVATLKGGSCRRTPHVKIYFLRKEPTAPLRIACVVSKKVSTSAVVRHRYQRLLRTVAGQFLSTLQTKYHGDMVWLASPSITSLTTAKELRESLTSYLT